MQIFDTTTKSNRTESFCFALCYLGPRAGRERVGARSLEVRVLGPKIAGRVEQWRCDKARAMILLIARPRYDRSKAKNRNISFARLLALAISAPSRQNGRLDSRCPRKRPFITWNLFAALHVPKLGQEEEEEVQGRACRVEVPCLARYSNPLILDSFIVRPPRARSDSLT